MRSGAVITASYSARRLGETLPLDQSRKGNAGLGRGRRRRGGRTAPCGYNQPVNPAMPSISPIVNAGLALRQRLQIGIDVADRYGVRGVAAEAVGAWVG